MAATSLPVKLLAVIVGLLVGKVLLLDSKPRAAEQPLVINNVTKRFVTKRPRKTPKGRTKPDSQELEVESPPTPPSAVVTPPPVIDDGGNNSSSED